MATSDVDVIEKWEKLRGHVPDDYAVTVDSAMDAKRFRIDEIREDVRTTVFSCFTLDEVVAFFSGIEIIRRGDVKDFVDKGTEAGDGR